MGDFSRIALDVIRENKLEILRVIVQPPGFNVNRIYPVDHGATRNTNLLQQACQVPYVDSIRFLTQDGADPDGPFLPFSSLTRKILEPTTVVKALLDHGVDPNCPGLPSSALFEVVKSASKRQCYEMGKLTTVVKALLDHGADVHHTRRMVGLAKDEKDSRQAIPILLYAVYAGDDGLDVVNLLVQHGADVNEGFISPLRLARQLNTTLVCQHVLLTGWQ